jgi:DNA-binding NarL/FixJ family response regulator
MIRVLVVDDHPVVRAGISALVRSAEDMDAVGEAPDGAAAGEVAAVLRPTVVLMDLDMPVDGIEGTRRVLAASPETRVVILTAFSDRERVLAAIDAGAIGYVLKDGDPDDLLDAIRTADQGDAPLAPVAASALLADRAGRRTGPELSEREREVLDLVGRGLPNKVIALRLGISEKTVKAHLTNIFRQIGVTDRTQAALWVERNGL